MKFLAVKGKGKAQVREYMLGRHRLHLRHKHAHRRVNRHRYRNSYWQQEYRPEYRNRTRLREPK